jgi:hypothetical protein
MGSARGTVTAQTIDATHPELFAVQQDVAFAAREDRLRMLQDGILRRIHPLLGSEIAKSHAINFLRGIARENGLCGTARQQDDVEHVIREGLAGRSAGVGHMPTRLAKNEGEQSATQLQPPRQSWRHRSITASELRRKTFQPTKYIVPGLLPEGASLLVSRPKLGKSWLLLELCIASAGGFLALGNLKPLQGDVLYLALEDSQRRLQRRIDKLLSPFRGEWPERLRIATEWRRLNEGGLDDLADWCQRASQPVLIAIDTLAKVRPPQTTAQTLYSADYAAMAGLHKIANERGIAVVAAHHDRKMDADDPFDTVSGTLGLTGAADTIIIIKKSNAGTTIHVRGRDIEDGETAAQFDKATCRWSLLGPASEVHRSSQRSRVIAALEAAGQALSVQEIMADTDVKNRNAIDLLLRKMVKDGEIERVGRGQYTVSGETGGKIGQKERLGAEHNDFPGENGNLSDLSDLSAGATDPTNGGEATMAGLEVDEPVEEGTWTV